MGVEMVEEIGNILYMKSCGHEDMNHRKRQSISRGFCIDHLSGSFLIFYLQVP